MDCPQIIHEKEPRMIAVGNRSYDVVGVRGQYFFRRQDSLGAGWTCASNEFTRVIDGLPPLPPGAVRPETPFVRRRVRTISIPDAVVLVVPQIPVVSVRHRLRTGNIEAI